ncbi:putative reductase 1 [Colletotrichum sidae]|uniref:Putative reductase 1 n=1 Tax=Colletotrichum sidae TaxID=1347389 RepID=A0A4V3I0A2_9PEZI|nr:putative reductase 1 [Colletotrichum sidae]
MPNETPVCEKKYLLNNGQYMPAVGLGTWQGGIPPTVAQSPSPRLTLPQPRPTRRRRRASHDVPPSRTPCAPATASSTRAQVYGVEKLVGQAVRESGVPREAVTVVTKFWGRWHHDPGRRVSIQTVPAVNQVEVHALCPSLKLVPFCQDKGIHVMGWGSLGGGDAPPMSLILTHEVFERLARARGCSVAVVHLSWAVQRGITVIPRSSSHSRIDNIRLITLTADEMSIMDAAQDTIGKHRSTDQLVKQVDGRKTIFGWTLQDFGWEDEYGNWLT